MTDISTEAKQVLDMIVQTPHFRRDLRRVIYDASALLGYSIDDELTIADEIINFLRG